MLQCSMLNPAIIQIEQFQFLDTNVTSVFAVVDAFKLEKCLQSIFILTHFYHWFF